MYNNIHLSVYAVIYLLNNNNILPPLSLGRDYTKFQVINNNIKP